MIVNVKKKLNRFKNVRIPRNKDLFARIGGRNIPMHQDGQVADFNTRPVDILSSQLADYESQMLRKSQMPSDTDTSVKPDVDSSEKT